jgi:hypothetical protein
VVSARSIAADAIHQNCRSLIDDEIHISDPALTGCRRNRVVHPITIAPRKPFNIVLVVDRSGSLKASGSCGALMAAAISFVDQFSTGRDKIGLVTFASSTYVNFPIANTFQTANPNIASILATVGCAGSTSSAQGLWTGYQQLLAVNEPDAVNLILFFTDGEPTGVTFDMPIAKSSPCSDYTPGSPDTYTMPSTGKGYIRGVYGSFSNLSQWFGILNPSGMNDLQPAVHSKGCDYSSNWPASEVIIRDFLGVPTKDIYGNSANTDYRPVTLNSYGLIDITKGENAKRAAANAADSAATNIRNGAIDTASGRSLSKVIIYSIGLGNAAFPASPIFLERVSNDFRSPVYDHARTAGLYISAASGSDLRSAFESMASGILRLSK